MPPVEWSSAATIISKAINADGASAYRTEASNAVVVIEGGVSLAGNVGIQNGSGDDGTYYDGASIYNAGSIYGRLYGITFNQGGNFIYNDPSGFIGAQIGIELDQDGSRVPNDGTIAAQIGVYVYGDANHLSNAGQLRGTDVGVETSGDNNVIDNAGVLRGGEDAIRADGDDLIVTNSGQISGGEDAFRGGTASNTRIRNTGTVVGDIRFGSGSNVYNGRGGTIAGIVYGGGGADVLLAGNDGETMAGLDGADSIYAGTGADTFLITHLSASDVDRVHHFSASRDTLQLYSGSFGKLAVDAPVTFAIGSKAASASDFVFYNATSGALYYDADGSGTKVAARVIARLDAGLHLTAHNFEAVAVPVG